MFHNCTIDLGNVELDSTYDKFEGMFKNLSINGEANETTELQDTESIKPNTYQDNHFHFFKSLYELYKFDSSDHELQTASVEYQPRPEELSKRKVIICHDIPKGVNQDPV